MYKVNLAVVVLLALGSFVASMEEWSAPLVPASRYVHGVPVQENRSRLGLSADIYALDADSTLWRMPACANDFHRLARLNATNEAIIGIDFRPADGLLYAVGDAGNLYQVKIDPPGRGNLILVSTLSPAFAGGFQALVDFNPVANALRLIGSNDQNYAVINKGSNLDLTVAQATITYAVGDVNALADPNLVGGAYSNNLAAATTTLFYGLDYQNDVLITIAAGPNGSSATGGGQLTTVGRLIGSDGNLINLAPTCDMDIYTDRRGINNVIGVSGRTLFSFDLAAATVGQDVPVASCILRNGGFIDLAADPRKCRPCN